jgi:dihydrofolate reductase
MPRKIILYIACSLDGYIATQNDDISFLQCVEKEGEDYGYTKFTETIDTLIVGRKTYEKVIHIGYSYHPDKEVYVISQTKNEAPYYGGDLLELIQKLKNKEGKNIYCDGGSQLIRTLLGFRQIDEIIVSIIPVMLGSGIRLFAEREEELNNLELLACTHFDTDLVQLHYAFKNKQ